MSEAQAMREEEEDGQPEAGDSSRGDRSQFYAPRV